MLHAAYLAECRLGCVSDGNSSNAVRSLSVNFSRRSCSQQTHDAASVATRVMQTPRRYSTKQRTTSIKAQATAKQATSKRRAAGRASKSTNKLSGYLTIFFRVLMNRVLEGSASSPLRTLYPPGRAIEAGNIKVSDLHTVYYEVYGNPDGQPAIVVHGGPGAGCYAKHAQFFDLRHWKVVLVDQRGCGASQPLGCLQDNTTHTLIQDYEKLRKQLKIKKWTLFGGSWGVALSLAYAQQHPNRIQALVLRGVCTMRPSEIEWMFGGGAGHLQPLGWQNFAGHIPQEERSDIVAAYHRRLTSADTAVRDAAAKAWLGWEFSVGSGRTSSLQVWDGKQWQQTDFPDPSSKQSALPQPRKARPSEQDNGRATASEAAAAPPAAASTSQTAQPAASQQSQPAAMSGFTAQAMLECHYSHNGAFLQEPLIQAVESIRHIPCIAVQGRLDYVCPVNTAYDLHCAWPEMELRIVPNAGHSMYDAGITHELLDATDRLRKLAAGQQSRAQSSRQYVSI